MKNVYSSFLLLLLFFACEAQEDKDYNQSLKVKEILDLTYMPSSPLDKHKLDLYIPQNTTNPPLLIWIHGGAWAFGDRKKERELARRFAEKGIAFAALSYRMSPALWADSTRKEGIQHPAHIKDVAAAFAYLKNKASKYNYNEQNLFVSGYSAGGHLSALLAMDPRYLAKHQLSPQDIRAAIPIAGAYDLMDYYEVIKKHRGKLFADQHVRGVFGEKDQDIQDASVINYIPNLNRPTLMISEDNTYNYTLVFEKAIPEAFKKWITFWHIREENHASLRKDLDQPQSKYRDRIIQFILAQKI
ncbi:MAG: alpha/beta hydrolase [Bacteroidota bacterium]